jgi:uncharacterized paraquat-inducible protein A
VADVAGKKVVIKTATYREDLKTCHTCHRDRLERLTYLLLRFPSEKIRCGRCGRRKGSYKNSHIKRGLRNLPHLPQGFTGVISGISAKE